MNRFFVFVFVIGGLLFAGPAYADIVGQQVRFFVDHRYDADGDARVSATLRQVGEHVYWYVDDDYWSALGGNRARFEEALNDIAERFDADVYEQSRRLWGRERSPGVDNDARITILLQDLVPTAAGYFVRSHNAPASAVPDSNEREMFFIAADTVLHGSALSVSAHEFQHLISFNQKEIARQVHEDTWLNEARSEYGIQEFGLNDPYTNSPLQRRYRTFKRTPSDSLVEWPNVAADYGIASLFAQYLADRFGTGVLTGTMQQSSAGIDAVNDALVGIGAKPRFGEVFNDWMVAVYINDTNVSPKYGYLHDDLRNEQFPLGESLLLKNNALYSGDVELQEWQPAWYQFEVPTDLASDEIVVSIDLLEGSGPLASVVAGYRDGSVNVVRPVFSGGHAQLEIPVQKESRLATLAVAISHGVERSTQEHTLRPNIMTLVLQTGKAVEERLPIPFTSPVSDDMPIIVSDGDLVRLEGSDDIYVVSGQYRRFLPRDVLSIYGLEGHRVFAVDSRTFFRYEASFYIRGVDGERVYVARPEGTKHWLNISQEQFFASGRNPGAIFTVDQLELDYYRTGDDITR